MRHKTLSGKGCTFVFVIVVFALVLSTSCSSGQGNNRGNRPSSNAVAETTTTATPAPTPAHDEEDVRKLIVDLSSALTRADLDALGNIYSDGFIMITTDGLISTKPEQLEMMRSGELKFDKMSFEELSVRGYGNTAVAVALAEAIQTFQGKAHTAEARVTFVAVKEGDSWRLVSVQLTPTQPQAKTGNSANSNGVVRTLPSNNIPKSLTNK